MHLTAPGSRSECSTTIWIKINWSQTWIEALVASCKSALNSCGCLPPMFENWIRACCASHIMVTCGSAVKLSALHGFGRVSTSSVWMHISSVCVRVSFVILPRWLWDLIKTMRFAHVAVTGHSQLVPTRCPVLEAAAEFEMKSTFSFSSCFLCSRLFTVFLQEKDVHTLSSHWTEPEPSTYFTVFPSGCTDGQ